ncbi:MAG: hypothetical protein NW200_01495, partial [Hyphomonadaceae bacterium]|nr:hypothetical protein [Hyphomonadaceae bacterium]
GAAATGVVLIAGVAASGGRDRALMRAALAAGLLVLCVYGAVEALFDMPLNRLDEPDTATGILERNPGKGVSILVACLWAGVGALAGRTPWRLGAAGALLTAAGALSLQFHMAANVAGFAAGLAGFALGYAAPRIGPTIVAGALAGWVLLAPWLTPLLFAGGGGAAMPMSWRMRGEIWRFAAERIAERPLTGWGLDASRQFGDTLLRLDGLDFRAIPLHPHSFSIQIWLEAGAVGALLMAGAIVAAGRAASRFAGTDRACAAAIAGAIAATGLIWNVSYGAWQEWWIATVFCALAFAAAVRRV